MPPSVRDRVQAYFADVPAAAAVYLFGSHAREEAGPRSDVDVAVLFNRPPSATLMGPQLTLAGELEQQLGTPVDLIVLNTAPADLVHRVLRDGDLLIDRDPSLRIRFEVAKPTGASPTGHRPDMTDGALVAKKLAQIDTCLSELRRLALPARLEEDVRERRFVEHTLQIAIQAALDVASHIVSDARLGEPQTNRDLFDLLAGAGWIDASQTDPLKNMAGFRNILVHGYDDVDLDIVRSILDHHLNDLADFASSVRARL